MSNKPKKTVCPITRDEFREKAQPISITIGDMPAMVAPAAQSHSVQSAKRSPSRSA